MKKLILPLILFNMIAGLGASVMFWLSGGQLIWLGTLLTTLPTPFLLIVLTNLLGIARTSNRLPLIQLFSFAGVGLVGSTLYQAGGIGSNLELVATGLTLFGAVFVQWFVWSYSSYGRQKSQSITKGRTLPAMKLHRLDESVINSESFSGSKTLLVFFRANWCPFCMNQLKEVAAQADRLKSLGVKVKFISNQGFEHSKELAKKLDLPEHFEILQDTNLSAAKTLGIEDIGGSPAGMSAYPADTVMATVISLDEDGKVIFGDETDNYRVRPHPDTFIPKFQS